MRQLENDPLGIQIAPSPNSGNVLYVCDHLGVVQLPAFA